MSVVQRLEKPYNVSYPLAMDEDDYYDYGATDQKSYTTICNCMLCLGPVDAPFYFENTCPIVRLHESCGELPGEINHSLHPYHTLKIFHCKFRNLVDYVCDVCFKLTPTFKYRCKKCEFSVCFLCIQNHVDSPGLNQRVEKFSQYHLHTLQLLYFPPSLDPPNSYISKYYKVRNLLLIEYETGCQSIDVVCCCCAKDIQGSAFVCVRCVVFFHESCLIGIPERFRSSIHPDHDLVPVYLELETKNCDACRKKIRGVELGCGFCDCSFHVSCGMRTSPGLKVDENVTLFYLDTFEDESSCSICNIEIWKGPLYRSVERNQDFHIECVLPSTLDHPCHFHQLTLTSSIERRSDATKYCCDVCEEEEDFEHYVYHCEECYFMAHAEYLFTEEDKPLRIGLNIDKPLIKAAEEVSSSKPNNENKSICQMNVLQCLKYDNNGYGGGSYFLDDNSYGYGYDNYGYGSNISRFCMMCGEVINEPFDSSFSNKVHKSCGESPGEINHPLHPQHPLKFHGMFFRNLVDYVCDVCHTLTYTHKYHCKACNVNICSLCISNYTQGLQFNPRSEIFTPHHQHALQLLYVPDVDQLHLYDDYEYTRALDCCCCTKIIQDFGLFCLQCELSFHESCLFGIPKEIKSSFHPDHPLFPRINKRKERGNKCEACHGRIKGVELGCGICECSFHVSCGNRTSLELRVNENITLFYFDDRGFCDWSCGYCDHHCGICCEKISDGCSMYRRIEQGKNFHIECIVPPTVEHPCHHHQLTLTSSVERKTEAEKYRCDVCEEEENFEHYVYHCEECYFNTHIECLFTEDGPLKVELQPHIFEVQEREHDATDLEHKFAEVLESENDNSLGVNLEHKFDQVPDF